MTEIVRYLNTEIMARTIETDLRQSRSILGPCRLLRNVVFTLIFPGEFVSEQPVTEEFIFWPIMKPWLQQCVALFAEQISLSHTLQAVPGAWFTDPVDGSWLVQLTAYLTEDNKLNMTAFVTSCRYSHLKNTIADAVCALHTKTAEVLGVEANTVTMHVGVILYEVKD